MHSRYAAVFALVVVVGGVIGFSLRFAAADDGAKHPAAQDTISVIQYGLLVLASSTAPTDALASSTTPDSPSTVQTAAASAPQAVHTAAAKAAPPQETAAPKAAVASAAASYPVIRAGSKVPTRVIIPSIGVDNRVIPVGLTASGDMAVPSGSTSNVGWWRGGTLPGNVGSAVFDAHVFAAFKDLDRMAIGDSVYVVTEGGVKERFVVTEIETKPTAQVSPWKLFSRDDARRLNLITCAGHLTPDHSTYTERIVVYTEYAGTV